MARRRSPVLGSPVVEYDLLRGENLRNPYQLYARLRDEAPVHWHPGLGGWVVTRYEDVVAAIADKRLSADRFEPYLERLDERGLDESDEPDGDPQLRTFYRNLRLWISFADPPDHTRLRALIGKALPPRVLRDVMTEASGIADGLLDACAAKGEFDVIADYSYPLAVTVITRLLGIPADDEGMFEQWSDDLTRYIGGSLVQPDRRERALRALSDLGDYLRDAIAQRRRDPGPDVVTSLITAQEGGTQLTDDEVVATCAMMLFAGHGTTTNLIGNGLFALLGHPDQLDRLRSDASLAGKAVEELLRYDSPVQMTIRIVREEMELSGCRFRPGERVFPVVASANRDERRFADPDVLDIERPENRHVSFGYGIHFCIGAPIARVEALIGLTKLVERFPRLAVVDEDGLEWQPTVGFRALERLPVQAATERGGAGV